MDGFWVACRSGSDSFRYSTYSGGFFVGVSERNGIAWLRYFSILNYAGSSPIPFYSDVRNYILQALNDVIKMVDTD